MSMGWSSALIVNRNSSLCEDHLFPVRHTSTWPEDCKHLIDAAYDMVTVVDVLMAVGSLYLKPVFSEWVSLIPPDV
ncbi:hypothetical protein TNCV_3678971 [Trichonephila clavipes]|nr:hypothetical protein TNCV_3678971 [Trichonephila clavipes]